MTHSPPVSSTVIDHPTRVGSKTLRVAAQALFAAACVFALYAALAPDDGSQGLLSRLLPWDKARHAATFYVLAGLAAAAFPRLGYPALAAGLAVYGLGIELLQAAAGAGRDAEAWDFVADLVGIAAVYGPLTVLAGWREAGR